MGILNTAYRTISSVPTVTRADRAERKEIDSAYLNTTARLFRFELGKNWYAG
jgi:hypothetical protein